MTKDETGFRSGDIGCARARVSDEAIQFSFIRLFNYLLVIFDSIAFLFECFNFVFDGDIFFNDF